MDRHEFIDFWCESHRLDFRHGGQSQMMGYLVRRISWVYLD